MAEEEKRFNTKPEQKVKEKKWTTKPKTKEKKRLDRIQKLIEEKRALELARESGTAEDRPKRK